MAKEIDFVSGNPCAEIQTINVSGSGGYTITLPIYDTANWQQGAPKGTIARMFDGDAKNTGGYGYVQTHDMMFDGKKWIRLAPSNDDVTKYTDVELQEKMADIESLFNLCDELGFDGREGGMFPLPPMAGEYNRCEEELIKRQELPKYHLEVNFNMEPGSPARVMIDTVAEQIRSTLDGVEDVTVDSIGDSIAEQIRSALNGTEEVTESSRHP